MLRLLPAEAQGCQDLWKPFKPCRACHVGIHWMALAEFFQLTTHVPGFQSVFMFLHHFAILLHLRATILSRGSYSWCTPKWPNRDVMYLYSSRYLKSKSVKGESLTYLLGRGRRFPLQIISRRSIFFYIFFGVSLWENNKEVMTLFTLHKSCRSWKEIKQETMKVN